MRRRAQHRWLVCLLTPLVLFANALPVSKPGCQARGVTTAHKCCGRCQADTDAKPSCCQNLPACCAKKSPATAAPCRCHKGSSLPTVPVPVDEQTRAKSDGCGQLAKQTVPSPAAQRAASSMPGSPLVDNVPPPVRIRYCIWLI